MVDKMREIMKSKPKIDIQRREIAEFMGVTPALVGYYFPDKRSLIEEAANPIIDAYIGEVKSCIASNSDALDKLRYLVHLFIRFNQESGYLLDFYMEHVTTRKNHNSLPKLRQVYDQINTFFAEAMRAGLIRGEDPRLVQSAVWGMCRYVGQQQSSGSAAAKSTDIGSSKYIADFIFGLIVEGIWVAKSEPTPLAKIA